MLKSKKSPYTHKVQYNTVHPRLGVVQGSFRTTTDAVKLHLARMDKDKLCFDIKVTLI